MNGINKVTLLGNLGKDPERIEFEGNTVVCKFSLATTESYKDEKGERHSHTEWHNVIVWNKLAELVSNYLKKGSMIYLEGKIKTRNYETKEGQKKYVTEIVGDNLLILDKTEK